MSNPTDWGTDVPEKVRRARRARGWTQRDLARHADVSLRTVVAFESGKPVNVSAPRIIAAAGIVPPEPTVLTESERLMLREQMLAGEFGEFVTPALATALSYHLALTVAAIIDARETAK